MKPACVKTSNVDRLMLAFSALENRGAEEACLMIVDGDPGRGKSRTLSWFAAQNDMPFVRARKEWTPNWMLKDLLSTLNVAQAPHGFEKRFNLALETLVHRADMAEQRDDTFAVIVDEADYICRSDKMLSTIRDFSDLTEIPFVLVGMGKIREGLKRFPQVTGRVAQYVRFNALTEDDVTALVAGLCDVEVAPDLVRLIHQYSKGYAREVKEAIASIERMAKRNGLSTVRIADMAGQTLMNDRATAKPVVVSRHLVEAAHVA